MTLNDDPQLIEAKKSLDKIIKKARVDLYKPIQIAEVLYNSRKGVEGLNLDELDTYKNKSTHWRDEVSIRLLGKVSTSSAQYQHNLWNENAMLVEHLKKLDEANRANPGVVERYIYLRFQERQDSVDSMIVLIEGSSPQKFQLADLLTRFTNVPGLKRSIDKAYEIIIYSLTETVVATLEAEVTVKVPPARKPLLKEFSDLTSILLGLSEIENSFSTPAHVYRVGVTNAADRGLDMWANFGPVIQVKHISLDPKMARNIVSKVESDNIIIVCRKAERAVIETIVNQLDFSARVRGVITETQLIDWYERCLRGNFANLLGEQLLKRLAEEFKKEFPQQGQIVSFLEERGYLSINPSELWEIGL